jgi:ribosomal protein S1
MQYRSMAILLAFLVFTSPGFGADSAPNKKTSPSKENKTQTPTRQRFKGEVMSLDAKAGTVDVKGTNGEKSFVTQDAAKDSLEVLKTGERVRVTYSEKEGKLVATSLARLKIKTKTAAKNQKNPSTSAKPDGKESNKSATK